MNKGEMADMASRAVVIVGDGFMPHVSSHHLNLHSLASDGCCGFLALRSHPPTDAHLANLAQLLDLHDAFKENQAFGNISESLMYPEYRFMGMKAAMLTNSEAADAIGRKAGFTVSSLKDQDIHAELLAPKLVDMVGASDLQKDAYDLLLLHLANDEHSYSVDWMNSLVGELRSINAKHLLLVLILGYGNTRCTTQQVYSDELLQLRPRQSYSIKTGKPLDDISEDSSLLVVYQQNGVTRRDLCKRLDLKEFQEKCGNLTILADRFLHEVAFKLWKAPKYGA